MAQSKSFWTREKWRNVMQQQFQRILVCAGLVAFCCRASLGDDFLQNLQRGALGEALPMAVAAIDRVVEPTLARRSRRPRPVNYPGGCALCGRREKSNRPMPKSPWCVMASWSAPLTRPRRAVSELAGLNPGDYVARATIAEGTKDFDVSFGQLSGGSVAVGDVPQRDAHTTARRGRGRDPGRHLWRLRRVR